MNAIGIENIRSLKNTGIQPLLPLTILLGKNSSGKSTFLRTLPLLKQSLQEKTLGPISLFGSLVDFGDFNTAISRKAKNQTISIALNIDIPEKEFLAIYFTKNISKKIHQLVLKLDFKKYESSEVLYISNCIIEVLGENLNLSFSETNNLERICLNEKDYTSFFQDIKVSYKDGNFFPIFQIEKNAYSRRDIFMKPLFDLCYKKTGDDKKNERDNLFYLIRAIEFLPICGKSFTIDMLKHSFYKETRIEQISQKIKENEINIEDFSDYLFISQIPHLLKAIEHTLNREVNNLFYSKPLRADAERYYRIQPLAIDEVSADGRNLISFIQNLNTTQIDNFKKWINKNFDFKIDIRKYEGHQSLFIKNTSDNEFSNISDMGFGYSQIIPIITQLWSIINKVTDKTVTNYYANFTFAIEQPELHLHPKMQRELMKAFCSAVKLAKQNKISLKIILETHSETMINYLGQLVESGLISEKDVSILLFEKEKKETKIRNVMFDEKGYLKDWPIDFF